MARDEIAASEWVAQLKHPAASRRREAAIALQTASTLDVTARQALLAAALGDEDARTRRAASLAWLRQAWMGGSLESTLPLLDKFFALADEITLRRADQSLRQVVDAPHNREAAVAVLTPLLVVLVRRAEAATQVAALTALRALLGFKLTGQRDVLRAIVAALASNDDEVAAAACEALGKFALDDGELRAMWPAVEKLRRGGGQARCKAAAWLAEAALVRSDRVALVALLDEPSAFAAVRSAAWRGENVAAAAEGLARRFASTLDFDAGQAMKKAVDQGGDVGAAADALEAIGDDLEYPRPADAEAIESSDNGEAPVAEAAFVLAAHYARENDLPSLEKLLARTSRGIAVARAAIRAFAKDPRVRALAD